MFKAQSKATLNLSEALSKATLGHVKGPDQGYPVPIPIYSVSGVLRVQKGAKRCEECDMSMDSHGWSKALSKALSKVTLGHVLGLV